MAGFPWLLSPVLVGRTLRCTRWRRYYCSISAPFSLMFTHPASRRHVCMEPHYRWRYDISVLGLTETLRGTSQKDHVLAMYSIFIYLFNYPLFTPGKVQTEWTRSFATDSFLTFLPLNTFTCIMELPSRVFNVSLNCCTRGKEVECLSQGHLNTGCWGILRKRHSLRNQSVFPES